MQEILIFVYGTLMEGFENYNRYLNGKVIKIENAYVYGRIYHLITKECPALIDGNDKVYGELITFKDDDDFTLLRKIDCLEKYFKRNTNEVVYLRKEVTAYLKDGREIKAYCYIFTDLDFITKDSTEYISEGDWKNYLYKKLF